MWSTIGLTIAAAIIVGPSLVRSVVAVLRNAAAATWPRE